MTMGENWNSLEFGYRAFPSTTRLRREWRKLAESVVQTLWTRERHMALPALVPGLVHARLAVALLAAGYRKKADLIDQSFLCLGCHAGLEIRMLCDFGAGFVHGVEMRPEVVQESVAQGLVDSDAVWVGDYWDYLRRVPDVLRNAVLMIAPEDVAFRTLWEVCREHIAPGGHLVVVAQPSTVSDIPDFVSCGPALEGAMKWYSAALTPHAVGCDPYHNKHGVSSDILTTC